MKRKLSSFLLVGFLLSGMIFINTSCDNRDDNVAGLQMVSYFFFVSKSDWKWNPNSKQYETFWNIDKKYPITKNMYDDGAFSGHVFLGTEGVDEVQAKLPFINTYQDKGFSPHVERISYEIILEGSGVVGFFIQTSDLKEHPDALGNYNFKINLIWNIK